MKPVEKWKKIEGYDGKYRISNRGRITRKFRRDSRVVHPFLAYGRHTSPYVKLTRYENGKLVWKKYNLRKLVAQYWMIGYDPNKPVFYRDDSDPWNCAINNLIQKGRSNKGKTRLTKEIALEIKEKLAANKHIRGYKAYLSRLFDVNIQDIENYWND